METYSENYKKMYNMIITKQDEEFCRWIDEVEKIVIKNTNFHLLDLEDEEYMINFEKCMLPSEMASIVLEHFEEYKNFIKL